jgi:hypothetical protein
MTRKPKHRPSEEAVSDEAAAYIAAALMEIALQFNAHLIHLHIGIDARAEPHEHVLLRKATRQLVLDAVTAIGAESGGMDRVMF